MADEYATEHITRGAEEKQQPDLRKTWSGQPYTPSAYHPKYSSSARVAASTAAASAGGRVSRSSRACVRATRRSAGAKSVTVTSTSSGHVSVSSRAMTARLASSARARQQSRLTNFDAHGAATPRAPVPTAGLSVSAYISNAPRTTPTAKRCARSFRSAESSPTLQMPSSPYAS